MDDIVHSIEHPSWDRIFHLKEALRLGVPVQSIFNLTKIDKWFLNEIQQLVQLELELRRYTLQNLPSDFLLELKQKGYSDAQIAHVLGNATEDEVYEKRKELKINRVYKTVDTCAAEFPATTPYFYSTFENGYTTEDGEFVTSSESIRSDRKKIIVLGSGPNRIGQGIAFDYACVHGVMAARDAGYESIMVHCNPETVSTDFDIADKLYFEPIFWDLFMN